MRTSERELSNSIYLDCSAKARTRNAGHEGISGNARPPLHYTFYFKIIQICYIEIMVNKTH